MPAGDRRVLGADQLAERRADESAGRSVDKGLKLGLDRHDATVADDWARPARDRSAAKDAQRRSAFALPTAMIVNQPRDRGDHGQRHPR